MQRELIAEITVPLYVRRYRKSDNIRAKYYEKGRKKLPLMYCDKHLEASQGVRDADGVRYIWKEFPCIRKQVKRKIDFLFDTQTNSRVVINPNQVGKSKDANINGQGIYYSTIVKHERDKMFGAIKDQLRQYVLSQNKITRFPLIIEVGLFDVIEDTEYSNGQRWDVGNRMLCYAKTFEDVLQDCGVIPDDDRLHITGPPAAIFCPIDNPAERKLVYRVYVDQRPRILNNPIYQKTHGKQLG